MIRMMILEMEEVLAETRATAARAIADLKEMRAAHHRLLSLADDWQERAGLALEKGREDLAKAALIERAEAGEEHAEGGWSAHLPKRIGLTLGDVGATHLGLDQVQRPERRPHKRNDHRITQMKLGGRTQGQKLTIAVNQMNQSCGIWRVYWRLKIKVHKGIIKPVMKIAGTRVSKPL